MGEEGQKYQKLWDFRRRDDEFDSSSDDSKSISQCEPVFKTHKLVSGFVSRQEGEASDLPKSPQFGPVTCASVKFGKDNESNVEMGKKTRAIKKNKMKNHVQDPNYIDDLKNFAKGILEDLKIEREKMFARMREEMRDIEVAESASKPTRKRGSGSRKRKVSPVKKNSDVGAKTSKIKESLKVVDEKVNHEPVTLDEKLPKSTPEKLSYTFHEIASSSHLSTNDGNQNLESRKSSIGEGGDSCYFQNQEQHCTISQMGSKNIGFYNQQCVQTSTTNNLFMVPHHQRLDNGFTSMPTSQNIVGNSTSGNIPLGLSMNGSDLFANNFRGYANPKIDGRNHAFRAQDPKDFSFI